MNDLESQADVVVCPRCLEFYWSEDGHPVNECSASEDYANTVEYILAQNRNMSLLEAMEKADDPEYLLTLLKKET